MLLYVESNFVLELVFDQEQRTYIEQILAVAEQGRVHLRLPALTLFEPFYRVTSHVKRRSELCRLLDEELRHLARSSADPLRAAEASVADSIRALDNASLVEYDRLYETFDRMLAAAQILSLTPTTYFRARSYQVDYDLDFPDAVIAASVIEDLERHQAAAAFVCRDRALTHGIVRAEFEKRRCVVLTNFERAAHFVTRPKGSADSA